MKKQLFKCLACGHEFEQYEFSFMENLGLKIAALTIINVFLPPNNKKTHSTSKASIECPKCKSTNITKY